jgi:hypothetical protein
MLWMGIWVHSDTGSPVQVVVDFGVGLSSSDVVLPWWLRLKTPTECIPHPYQMYFSVFEHCNMLWVDIWVHLCTGTPVQVVVDVG